MRKIFIIYISNKHTYSNFYIFQYNENNQQFSTKIIKISLPLRGLDEITRAFMELCQGIKKRLQIIPPNAVSNQTE